MPDIQYINTHEIRKDLVGFLKTLASGQEFVVLNRSKPLVKIKGRAPVEPAKTPQQNMKEFLAAAARARASAKGVLDPNKPIKELYAETMAQKYGIPGR